MKRNEKGQFESKTFKVAKFDGRLFYNARHLHNYLVAYYGNIKSVTYEKVAYAISKRLKTIDRFYNIEIVEISATMKRYLKLWMRINQGYEHMVAFETNTLDEFIIKYNDLRMLRGIYPYYNMNKSSILLAYKPNVLIKLAKIFDKHDWEMHYQSIFNNSWYDEEDGHHYYKLQIASIRQNIF